MHTDKPKSNEKEDGLNQQPMPTIQSNILKNVDLQNLLLKKQENKIEQEIVQVIMTIIISIMMMNQQVQHLHIQHPNILIVNIQVLRQLVLFCHLKKEMKLKPMI